MRAYIVSLISASVVTGCGGVIGSSSSSAKAGDGGGVEASAPLDATNSTGLSSDASGGDAPQGSQGFSFDGATVPDGGCSPTESILTCQPAASFAACWTCGKHTCASQLTACAQDPACNAAIAGALNCVDEGGAAEQCFPFVFMSADDAGLSALQSCLTLAYTQCSCMMSQGSTPADSVDADLPLCSCTTVPPYGNGMCMQTASCHIPTCPVSGAPCCTSAGLCGCASAIPGGPDLTCN